MTIQLVNINGQLVGRRFQDRYNMEILGYVSIGHCRNSVELKRLRRANSDFTFTITKGDMLPIITQEHNMLPAYIKMSA